uniref:Probable leucine aminopeptidase MCYG_03459-like n=1 Tax=Saccoglossus kowalevskii TaxID=10224 RepID=A0ABM0LU85_SACKO|nr:PREDICTED: probable leucine aminopeptidase MCYG_03459-like [Saccoglossus kowalevskii]
MYDMEFTEDILQFKGRNIIAVFPGTTIGTADDHVLLVGAHYDTVSSSPGVDDNGSGLAVLLETARILRKEMCKPKHTIIFVAFDFGEKDQLGSFNFVHNWLPTFLSNSDGTNSTFMGAIIMDCVMNYNNTENSQHFPLTFSLAFPELYFALQSENFKGNFLAVVGREHDDSPLLTRQELMYYENLLRSDHAAFWRNVPKSYSAIYLTDTREYRGSMVRCYHQSCDNIASISDNGLLYMAKITRTLVNMIKEIAVEEQPGGCVDSVLVEENTHSTTIETSGTSAYVLSVYLFPMFVYWIPYYNEYI